MKQKLFPNIKNFNMIFSIAILVITILILLLRLVLYVDPDEKKDAKDTKDSAEKVSVSADDNINFKYNIESSITFKDFNSNANPGIKNDPSNKNLMQIKIIENKNKSLIYTSSYIKPGVNERVIKLTGNPLDAGTYDCTAEIFVFDDDLKIIATYTQPVKIIIENNITENSTETS